MQGDDCSINCDENQKNSQSPEHTTDTFPENSFHTYLEFILGKSKLLLANEDQLNHRGTKAKRESLALCVQRVFT